MSKKIVLGLVLVSAFAACQRQPAPQQDIYVPPVSQEPVFQGKYGTS